jgi:protein-S-isoprenylcysteine O-methyltransferase Ste14
MIIKIGKLFYRYRALIAAPFFVALAVKGRSGSSITGAAAVFLTLIGLAIRAWAAGYIGRHARGQQFDTVFRITSGPYRLLRHPLYIGNFFLVLAAIVLFWPPRPLAAVLLAAFIFEYGVIAISEEIKLKDIHRREVAFSWHRVRTELSTWIVVGLVYFIFYLKVCYVSP